MGQHDRRLIYGWLDDDGLVCCWRDYPPASNRPFITRKVIIVKPCIETHGEALW